MAITYDALLDHVKRVIQPTLESKGYMLSSPPATRTSMIWFVKEARMEDMLHRFVEFQTSGFSPSEITRVAINLARRSYFDFDYPPTGAIQKGDLYVPLTPWLWKEKNADPDSSWWYLHPLNQLDTVLNDMLEKIIHYGIPFIEDMNSTQTSWLER